MQDLTSKREKFLQEAADCELIGSLATDAKKRETFRQLAAHLRQMVREIDEDIAARKHTNNQVSQPSSSPQQPN